MWARRSGVDHSLGMGEAPGSNPGESSRSLCGHCAFVFADGMGPIHYLHSITTTFREISRQHSKYAILSAYPR